MNLLAFDTVLNKTFITLTDGATFESRTIESDEKNYHSAYLISELKKLVPDFSKIDAIATNIGPGSFTGIRVCLTVANVMAAQLKIPLVGVSSVEVLAQLGSGQVFLDARRGDYIYYEATAAPKLIKKDDAAAFVRNGAVCDTNCHTYFAALGVETINFESGDYPLGEILAKIALEKFNTSGGESQLNPLYLQTPPVFIRST